MVELKDASFRYGGVLAFKGLSFKLEKGEKVVLLGVNGAGKSTLLKVLNGLLFLSEGVYLYKDREISKKTLKDKNFLKLFRKETALLFQNPDSMLFNPTVYDELAFNLRRLGFPDKEIKERVLYWAEKCSLLPFLEKPPFELSGGQRQKLALACLLPQEPELLLLDEPTAHLDPRSTGWLIDLLWELPCTIVTATHNLSLAMELGSRAIVLSEDHGLLYDGGVEDFLKSKELLFKAGFVHKHGRRGEHFHFF